jgi:hypothetical protein
MASSGLRRLFHFASKPRSTVTLHPHHAALNSSVKLTATWMFLQEGVEFLEKHPMMLVERHTVRQSTS